MFCIKARCGHGCYIFQMQKTIADAVEFVGGISACSFHVFVLELMENGDVIGFFHSQYGSGTVISAFEINAKRTTGSVPLPPVINSRINRFMPIAQSALKSPANISQSLMQLQNDYEPVAL